MTVVGKILVFLNLVFSLAVGGFAIMDYTARTHWAAKYNTLSKKYQVVQASATTWQNDSSKLAKEKQDLNDKLNTVAGIKDLGDPDGAAKRAVAVLAARADAIEKLKKDVSDLRDNLTEAKKKVTLYETTATAAQTDTKSKGVDVAKMREILTDQQTRNIELVKAMNGMRDRAVAAEIQARTFKDINGRLEGQLQDMARDVARMRANAGSASGGVARGANPPPDNIEGLIRRTDGNLVTITIGSDAGLLRGHTLEVFRLGQNPKYLGRIKIVEVTATQAVGQATGRMSASMQPGDTVASRIMGGR